ncbi:NAD(P)/FAD-dependent oxidoreductase [Olivibacter sitiensis]|uniref:NAD(P)/FAD-dependent oxidoreductase n=1 Tax=Olivibacter sitiensis TaxID=376470 RepID=UPI000414E95D|nr:FAD-dependent oxidoreductase [Olivibacter sitiensis]
MQEDITIVGGGIAGLCAAYYLLKEGWKVTIIDAGNLENSCSYGNAGMIVPSHFTPLAAPGIVAQGIKWMLDSKSPFYVKPSPSMSLLSWGWQFVRHANAKHVQHSAPFLRDLNLLSSDLYQDLAKEDGFDFELRNDGILMLFKTEKTAEEEHHLAAEAKALGLDIQILNKEEVQALEPNTKLDVLGAVHYKCDSHLYPNALMHQLIRYIENKGATIRKQEKVTGFEIVGKEIRALITSKGKVATRLVLLTGGAELPQLAKTAGLRIPIMPGKGYSFMHDTGRKQLVHPSLLLEARVAVTPMNGQVRFGGTMELAALNNQINMNRVEGIVNAIPKYYPDIQLTMPKKEDIWFGFRPCSPDGLPYLGFSGKLKNLMVAGGCGMMGLSLGPAVGKIISDLANKHPLPVSIAPFDPERFD